MYCISINYKNTGTEMRSKFAFSEEKRIEIMNEAKKRGIATQCVLLCTCGR
ncbi:MAG: glutamyl-tRNA reductase, partial [Firmicutes bacterium]|nr:glutamyl-tRNA reductase [Bacillota bacterium]